MSVSFHHYYMPHQGGFSPGAPLEVQDLLRALWSHVPLALDPPVEGQRISGPMDGASLWIVDGHVVAALNWATWHPNESPLHRVKYRSERPFIPALQVAYAQLFERTR